MNVSCRALRAFTSLAALSLSLSLAFPVGAADSDVRLSSLGFVPERTKFVTVLGEATTYEVKEVGSHNVVLSGVVDPGTGKGAERVSTVELTELAEGSYFVQFAAIGRSIDFRVTPDAYNDALLVTMVGFYGWRSGVDIHFEHQGNIFSHQAGHLAPGLDYPSGSEQAEATGGWYDAGDYGRYVLNGAFSAGMMLKAWEQFGDNLARMALPIPETGGSIPDFLAEVKYELDWILKMQLNMPESSGQGGQGGALGFEDNSGAVLAKLASDGFPDFVLPSDEHSTLYFAPASSPTTASFAAVMAQASRVFRPIDEPYADVLLTAALAAADWLEANPGFIPGMQIRRGSGDYRGNEEEFPNRMVWALAELWETTGDEKYLKQLEVLLSERTGLVPATWDWRDLGNMGVFTYALSQREGRDEELFKRVVAVLANSARLLRENAHFSPYGRSEAYYFWGSNGGVARNCMTLQISHILTPDPRNLDVCAQQISYLFGRNEYNRSQVTGIGLAPPQEPHHRISGSDTSSVPYPGLLVGGGTTMDDWLDSEESFQTNEIAINWNAALVYALAGFANGELVYDGSATGTSGPYGQNASPAPEGQPPSNPDPEGQPPSNNVPETWSPAAPQEGGCGCSTPRSSPTKPLLFFLTLATAYATGSRRRRSRY